MKHRLRIGGHECDRFVVRGFECPFRRTEEEDDEEEEEDPQLPEPKVRQPAMKFPQQEDVPSLMVPARRQPPLLVQQALEAVSKVEAEKSLERIGDIQGMGGLLSIPEVGRIRGALSGQTVQGLMEVLTAIAVSVSLARMPSTRFAMPGLAVASSERHVAKQFSLREAGPADIVSEGLRRLLGFGPVGAGIGSDVFSETGFS